MKRSKSRRGVRRVRVSADGVGVVSHAGVGMLREVADLTGLIGNVTEVLADTYQGPWVHEPGRVFADLAVAVADGADCVSGIGSLVDQQDLHGPVASLTTTAPTHPDNQDNPPHRPSTVTRPEPDLPLP